MSIEQNHRTNEILSEQRPACVVGPHGDGLQKNEEFQRYLSHILSPGELSSTLSIAQLLSLLHIRLTRFQLKEISKAAKANALSAQRSSQLLVDLRLSHASKLDHVVVRPEHILNTDGKREGTALTIYTHRELRPDEPNVLTRDEFDTALIREIARSHRTNTPLGILLISPRDILPPDEEGKLTYSRSATDPSINGAMAQCLLDTARATDSVYYLGPGGKEFAIILSFPDVPENGDGIAQAALRYAHELHTYIGSDIPLDVGVARFYSSIDLENHDTLYRQAWFASQSSSLLLAADMAHGHAKNQVPNDSHIHIFEFNIAYPDLVHEIPTTLASQGLPLQG